MHPQESSGKRPRPRFDCGVVAGLGSLGSELEELQLMSIALFDLKNDARFQDVSGVRLSVTYVDFIKSACPRGKEVAFACNAAPYIILLG